jgi:hypothetical protein
LWLRIAGGLGQHFAQLVLGLSDVEDRFTCTACCKRGADLRPDFNWNKMLVRQIGYR